MKLKMAIRICVLSLVILGLSPLATSQNFPVTPNPNSEKTLILFSPGTSNSKKVEKCLTKATGVPRSMQALEREGVHIHFLCSYAVDGNEPGSYIEKRKQEILSKLRDFLRQGYQAKNIFLSGQSAGAWASLTAMKDNNFEYFNAGILFAPACCNPRDSVKKDPFWRKTMRPKLIMEILKAKDLSALVFVYPDDVYNRVPEMRFLKNHYPNTVTMFTYGCRQGHFTGYRDCAQFATTAIIRKYIELRKKDFEYRKELSRGTQ